MLLGERLGHRFELDTQMKLHSKQPAIVTSIGYLAGKMCDIKLKSAGTNTRFAPCRDAPRCPCCFLCSARARSGLRTTQPASRFRYAGSGITEVIPHPVLYRMVYDLGRFDWAAHSAVAA